MIQAISNSFAQIILWLSGAAGNLWENINVYQYSPLQIALDILLVAILFYWILMFIKGSRASKLALYLVLEDHFREALVDLVQGDGLLFWLASRFLRLRQKARASKRDRSERLVEGRVGDRRIGSQRKNEMKIV